MAERKENRPHCLGCGDPIRSDHVRHDPDGDPLCPTCYDRDFIERRNAERRAARLAEVAKGVG